MSFLQVTTKSFHSGCLLYVFVFLVRSGFVFLIDQPVNSVQFLRTNVTWSLGFVIWAHPSGIAWPALGEQRQIQNHPWARGWDGWVTRGLTPGCHCHGPACSCSSQSLVTPRTTPASQSSATTLSILGKLDCKCYSLQYCSAFLKEKATQPYEMLRFMIQTLDSNDTPLLPNKRNS